jgi:hypothetical protein
MRTQFQGLSTREIREVSMYGCTEAQLRQSIESSPTLKLSGPAMVILGMLSDAQEIVSYQKPDANTLEGQRQLLNQAKFVIANYVMQK